MGRRLSDRQLVELLQAPTLGALRRGHTNPRTPSPAAWLLAHQMVTELRRGEWVEEIADACRFAAAGAAPCAIARRLRAIANRVHAPMPDETVGARQGAHEDTVCAALLAVQAVLSADRRGAA